MVTFLRSKLYLNFWLFALKGAAAVAVIACMCVAFPLVSMGIPIGGALRGNQDYEILLPVALVGIAVGFVSSCLGFWLMYLALRLKPDVKTTPLGWVTGVILSVASWRFLNRNGYALELNSTSSWTYLIFPVLPMVVCVYAFMRFTEKHLSESARSSTEPASMRGIF